jgi:lactoylglutathione lyase
MPACLQRWILRGPLSFHDAFPIFHTPDLARAVGFYRDRLGFEERFRYPEDGSPAFVLVGLGTFALGLAGVSELEPAGRVALWLYCDDVDAEIDTLRTAGVEIAREPEEMEWGERMAAVLDPDGNEIYLGRTSRA